MTDTQSILKGHSWLQVTTSRDNGISAFFRRFHKSPEMCIEGQIGQVQCWYIGPCPVVESEEHHDKEYKAV